VAETKPFLSDTQIDSIALEFQNGSLKAFEQVYNLYAESMQGVIFNIVKDADAAQEVMQDVFIKAWKKHNQYSPEKGRVFTWLLNISRNAAIDKVRSADYRKSQQNVSSSTFADVFESHDDLHKRVDGIGLKDVIKNLGEKCRSLIELLYFQGYTQSEVADETATPLGTVKTNSRRCIGKLREVLVR
jgi:RNA polymerase sigma-70 factor (ECF subfamily)